MKKKLTHNLFLKILSVLFAFMLWIIVVIVNDPYKTVTISGVPITIINEEEVTSQGIGQLYSVVSPQNRTVSIKVYGQRSKVDNLKAEDIQAVVDFSEVSSVGAAYIKVAEPEGITILGKTPEMMKIDIDALQERTLEIKVDVTGTVAEGYMVDSARTSPSIITVIGPESVMQKVARAQVQVDVDGSTDDITETAKIRLYDASGKMIDYERDPNVRISEKTAVISVETLMIKEVAIRVEAVGDVNENYKFKDMTQSRETVILKGHRDVLSEVEEIVITKESALVDMSGTTESKDIIVDISGLLPEGISIVNAEDKFITVSIITEPIVERSIIIPFGDINVLNLAEDLEIVADGTMAEITVKLRGLEADVNGVTVGTLKPYINMTSCGVGINTCKVYMFPPSTVTIVDNAMINVRLEYINQEVIVQPEDEEILPVETETTFAEQEM